MATFDVPKLRVNLAGELNGVIEDLRKIKTDEYFVDAYNQVISILESLRDLLLSSIILDKKVLARQTYLLGRCMGQLEDAITRFEQDWPSVAEALVGYVIRLKNLQVKLQKASDTLTASQN